jgi:hypothetical protein
VSSSNVVALSESWPVVVVTISATAFSNRAIAAENSLLWEERRDEL